MVPVVSPIPQGHFRVWFRETMVPVVSTVHVVLSSKLTLLSSNLELYAVKEEGNKPELPS